MTTEQDALHAEVAKQRAEMYEAGRKTGRLETITALLAIAEKLDAPEDQRALVRAARQLSQMTP